MIVKRFLIAISIFALVFSSCTVSNQLKQLNIEAQQQDDHKSYEDAFSLYNQIITSKQERGKKAEASIYQNAGISAWNIGDEQNAIRYLEEVKEQSAASAATYYYIAKAYLKVDNLSREIINLEEFTEKYPNDKLITEVNSQLFMAYVRSENWQKAFDHWNMLEVEQQNQPNLIEGYIVVNQQMGNSSEVLPLANKLLKADSDNPTALEVLALYYYNLAEDRYQAEMKAYEKNRTNRQYKQLLDALKVINSNFKVSRDYFERLYKQNPDPRFANYLGNIYTRFDNKQKAKYYYGKAKQN